MLKKEKNFVHPFGRNNDILYNSPSSCFHLCKFFSIMPWCGSICNDTEVQEKEDDVE